jgi:ribosomal protein L16/L10AE
MLQPKRTKFRKTHKGRNRGLANAGNEVSFGTFGLKATSWSTDCSSNRSSPSCHDPSR